MYYCVLLQLANCTSLLPGHKLITSEEAVSLDEPVTNSHLISDICVSGLLDEDSDTMLITNSLVYNLSMFQVGHTNYFQKQNSSSMFVLLSGL